MTLVLTRQMSDPRRGPGAAALADVHTLRSTSRARVLKHLAKEACDSCRRSVECTVNRTLLKSTGVWRQDYVSQDSEVLWLFCLS